MSLCLQQFDGISCPSQFLQHFVCCFCFLFRKKKNKIGEWFLFLICHRECYRLFGIIQHYQYHNFHNHHSTSRKMLRFHLVKCRYWPVPSTLVQRNGPFVRVQTSLPRTIWKINLYVVQNLWL